MKASKAAGALHIVIPPMATVLIGIFLKGKVSFPTIAIVCSFLLLFHLALVKLGAKNLMLFVYSVYCTFFLLEAVTYLLICSEIIRPDFYSIDGYYFGATDRPYVRFDSISGYKYIPGRPRVVKVDEGVLVYDHIMPVNNRGYCSVTDYPYKKANNLKKRLLVLGDSFSAGEITDTTWVDLLNMKLAADSVPVELFNFGLEAAGISGWHSTFFKEIVPNYDFDGIVIANFGDVDYYSSDMARPFVIKHSLADHSAIGFVEELPKDAEEFSKKYQSKLYYESSVYPTEYMEHCKQLAMHVPGVQRVFKWHPLHLYFLHLVSDAINFIREYLNMRRKYIMKAINPAIKQQEVNSWGKFAVYYSNRSSLTKEILDYCASRNKEIYLVSIPSFNVAEEDSLNYHNNIYNRQLKFLAQIYDGSFFDGYNMLDSISRADDEIYHLYNDSHWNRKGIDLFVKSFPESFFDQRP